MKSLLVLLLVSYLVGIDGRHFDHEQIDEELPDAEEQSDLTNRIKEHASQMRHRRRSRQMYGYDYQPPFYYDNRRDYSFRQQEEYFSRIIKYLEEIITNLRRPPPPPPQPVYIPYPVPFNWGPPAPSKPCQKVPQVNESTTQIPDFTQRFPEIEDENQVWSAGEDELPEEVEEGDGSRPISFNPVEPSRPTSRPPPPVEHGSQQAGMEQTTRAPAPRPGTCETAILTCCSIQDRMSRRDCFVRAGCVKTYATNRACDPLVIQRVLENFRKAYAPISKN